MSISIYIYISIYLYLSIYIYIPIYLYLYIYMSISIYLYLYLYLYIFIYMSISISLYLYIYIPIYLYIYISIYLYIYIYISIYIYLYIYIYIYLYIYISISISLYVYIYISIYLYIYIYISISIYLYIHIYRHAWHEKDTVAGCGLKSSWGLVQITFPQEQNTDTNGSPPFQITFFYHVNVFFFFPEMFILKSQYIISVFLHYMVFIPPCSAQSHNSFYFPAKVPTVSVRLSAGICLIVCLFRHRATSTVTAAMVTPTMHCTQQTFRRARPRRAEWIRLPCRSALVKPTLLAQKENIETQQSREGGKKKQRLVGEQRC